jgi:FtsZ-binding cell division protein ZapB
MARKDKNFKKLIRLRMKKTGESYQAAQRQLLAQLARRGGHQADSRPSREAAPSPGPRFAIHQFFEQRPDGSAVEPTATEAHRLRIERLNRRLKAAVAKLYPRKSLEAALIRFEEQVRQGKSLDHLVLALEHMVQLKPAIDAMVQIQPTLTAIAPAVAALTDQISASVERATALQSFDVAAAGAHLSLFTDALDRQEREWQERTKALVQSFDAAAAGAHLSLFTDALDRQEREWQERTKALVPLVQSFDAAAAGAHLSLFTDALDRQEREWQERAKALVQSFDAAVLARPRLPDLPHW